MRSTTVLNVLTFVIGTHAKEQINKPFSRGGVGVEVLEVFWEELWLHFFWPTFWLHCILYFTYRGGFAPRIGTAQNAM